MLWINDEGAVNPGQAKANWRMNGHTAASHGIETRRVLMKETPERSNAGKCRRSRVFFEGRAARFDDSRRESFTDHVEITTTHLKY